MKKNKRFLYDMENIPDRFLDEAENAPVVKKKIRWSTIISVAACLALIWAVPAGVSKIKISHNNIPGSPEVTSETDEVTEISEVSETELTTDISEEAAETEQEQSYRSVHITVEAGSILWHTAALLEENGICDADRFIENFNRGSDEYGFTDEVPVPDDNNRRFTRMEGYIMPGEYDISVKENDDSEEYYNSISKVFYERTQETLTKEMRDRASELGMTVDEIMTLASIVEQETWPEDLQLMKNIASVFYNRLSENNIYEFDTLCSDPTREYGDRIINDFYIYEDNLNKILKMTGSDQNRGYKEKAVNPNINNEEDMSEINLFLTYLGDAYNTYKNQGLPPGPICSPGENAINAVLWPNDTDYLYFCTNIETKETYFAETLEEHEANLSLNDTF